MYREVAARNPKEAPPAEIVYRFVDRSRNLPAVGVFQLIAIPPLVAAAFSLIATPTIGLLAMIAAAAFVVWWGRRKASASVVVLRVEGDELVVQFGKKPKAHFPLATLANVALDTKTIQRVQEGASAIPAMRFIDSRVGPEVDTARIVLVAPGQAPFTLSEAYGAHMDASEWLGKIRVFLRKHGWVPEDEREPVDESGVEGKA